MHKNLRFILIITAVVIMGLAIDLYIFVKQSAPEPIIQSYADCIKYTNAITLTYPAQCQTKDGRSFTEPLTDAEKDKLKPPTQGICQNLCGNNVCEEVVCFGTGCPCAETPATCPADCGPKTTGTLTGHLTIGPFCPVERVGVPCPVPEQAYTSRQVMVYSSHDQTLITQKYFDTNDDYSIPLKPGTYLVNVKENFPFTQRTPNKVIIKKGQTLTLNFNIDTGIR